ncbi:MAG: tetratricopeptide repeat protein, partial [Desulfobacterales bacterium]|nr:tetratricopeptide repeat protein [Desulfobacterales bacterium]
IIISDETLVRLSDPTEYYFRFIEKIQLNESADAMAIFEIYDVDPEPVKFIKIESRNDYERGLLHFYNADYDKAMDCFEVILNLNPNDKIVLKYMEQSQNLKQYSITSFNLPDIEAHLGNLSIDQSQNNQ